MINKILIAVDRSPHNRSVFDSALSLAQATGADLMLLHVLSPKEPDYPIAPVYSYYPLVETRDYAVYQQQFDEYERQGLELLRNLTEEASAAGVKSEFTQLEGNSGRKICELAANWSADMIMVGSRGLKGFKEMFLGSVSNYVTHHAPCSVFIVRNSIDSQSAEQDAENAAQGIELVG